MSDTDVFEARFRSAFMAYVTEIPSEIDPLAIVQSIAVERGPLLGGWTWPRLNLRFAWAALIVLSILALLAALVVGSRRPPDNPSLTVIAGPQGEGVGPIAAGSSSEAWTWNWDSVWRLTGSSWSLASTEHAINISPDTAGPGHVRHLHQSADGTIWAGVWTAEGEVGALRRLDPYDGTGSAPWSNVGSGPAIVGETADGSVLVASEADPIRLLTKDGKAYWVERELAPGTDLVTGCLTGIALGADDSVWLGSAGGCMFQRGEPGLARYDAGIWQSVEVGGEPNLRVAWLAAAPDGSVWVASLDRSLAHYVGGHWDVVQIPHPLTNDWMNGFAIASDGSVLVACNDGLARFDGESWTMLATGAPVYGVDVAHDGTVWVGGTFGAARIEGLSQAPLPMPLDLPAVPPTPGS